MCTTDTNQHSYMLKYQIDIIGSNQQNNELLRISLENGLQLECSCYLDFSDLLKTGLTKGRRHLLLFDCIDFDEDLLKLCFAQISKTDYDFFIILINAGRNCDLHKCANHIKIRGIFYRDDSLNQFHKGIRIILNGGLWLTRKILSECICSSMQECEFDQALNFLSFREKEIMQLLSEGAGNKEIAERLNISIHTVKTHLYNTYKKIGVPNRLQAMLWAGNHLNWS